MVRHSESGAGRRGRLGRVLTAVLLAAFAVLLTPGTASAYGGVTGKVDCYTRNSNGTYTFVVGYYNSGGARSISVGWNNQQTPSRINGTQPTQFSSGAVHGAFSVTLDHWEVQNAQWRLSGGTMSYADAMSDGYYGYGGYGYNSYGGYDNQWGSRCPAPTQLPADGNGLGPAIGLSAAGVVGALMLWRFRRRLERAGTPMG